MYSFLCFVLVLWYYPVPSQRPLAKRGKATKMQRPHGPAGPLAKRGECTVVFYRLFYRNDLGQCQCMVPYAICFTTQIQHVFLFICWCLWHCPGVSQIEPLAKRGWQRRCKGQLALQKHAAGATGGMGVWTFFQGLRE